MTERINKLYKPAELVAAQHALLKSCILIDANEASRTLIELHKLGWRLVYVGKDSE